MDSITVIPLNPPLKGDFFNCILLFTRCLQRKSLSFVTYIPGALFHGKPFCNPAICFSLADELFRIGGVFLKHAVVHGYRKTGLNMRRQVSRIGNVHAPQPSIHARHHNVRMLIFNWNQIIGVDGIPCMVAYYIIKLQ